MKLLFDHNIYFSPPSPAARRYFPESTHVAVVGLGRATDWEIWAYARDHGYAIVTKDADFNDLSVLYGALPKIVWLRIGNTTTSQIEHVLRQHYTRITKLDTDPTTNLLTTMQ